MQPTPAKRLIVTVSESEHRHGHPTSTTRSRLLALFKEHDLPGAVAYRTVAGYAGNEPMKTSNLVDLSGPLPVRIEVVASAEAIDRVLPDVYDILERGLVEIQDTQVIKWWAGAHRAPAPPNRETLVRTTARAKSLQIQIAEKDRWEGEPLYEAIVKRARQLGIAGASVYRGILGYGSHQQLHAHHLVRHDDPILISIIDSPDRIDELVAAIDRMVNDSCVLAMSEVDVVKYTPREARAVSAVPLAPSNGGTEVVAPESEWSPETNGHAEPR